MTIEELVKIYEKRLPEKEVEEMRRYAEMVKNIKPNINYIQFYLNCLVVSYLNYDKEDKGKCNR